MSHLGSKTVEKWSVCIQRWPAAMPSRCSCGPQKTIDVSKVCSRGHRLETILVMKSAENGLCDDAITVTNLMAARNRHEAIMRRIGNAWPHARVRTAVIIARHPHPEHAPQMALIERNHEIQTLTSDRAD